MATEPASMTWVHALFLQNQSAAEITDMPGDPWMSGLLRTTHPTKARQRSPTCQETLECRGSCRRWKLLKMSTRVLRALQDKCVDLLCRPYPLMHAFLVEVENPRRVVATLGSRTMRLQIVSCFPLGTSTHRRFHSRHRRRGPRPVQGKSKLLSNESDKRTGVYRLDHRLELIRGTQFRGLRQSVSPL